MDEIAKWVTAVLAVLGGIGAVAAAISAYVSKLLGDRFLESHKASLNQETERLRATLSQNMESFKATLSAEADRARLLLKKQELIFSRELDAATAFVTLRQSINPKYSFPDMDRDDACEKVADKFESHSEAIQVFLTQHGPIVSSGVHGKLESARGLAEAHKFDFGIPGEYDKGTLEAAEKLLTEMKEAEDQMLREIRNWELPDPVRLGTPIR